jgi:branched-chain amino acid transport system substrate-binding protein
MLPSAAGDAAPDDPQHQSRPHRGRRVQLLKPATAFLDAAGMALGDRMKFIGFAIVLLVSSVLSYVFFPSYVLAQASVSPVKIGLLLDMTGPYADIGGPGSIVAARMAVEDFGGKVLGRPIEMVSGDHNNKADIASAIAREWFDVRGVDAIMEVVGSATGLAVNEIAKARGKIVFFNASATTQLTNEACGPYSVHYAFDTYALARGTGSAMMSRGFDSWFFVTVDYAFGRDLEKDATSVVVANGGKILGSAKHPLNSPDFASYLLTAQASKAKVIGLANAGGDTINAIKQASEFGMDRSGQKLAGLLIFLTEIESIGAQIAQNMVLTEAFYWNMDDDTRAWSRRFFERHRKMPSGPQAGVYSATMNYLKAVATAASTDSASVMKVLKSGPINDFFAKGGRIREDNRMVHDMYLFEVKKPADIKEKWDLYNLVATIPGDQAFQSLSQSRCPLVGKK